MLNRNDAFTTKIYGDLSRADAVVLSDIARRSKHILEFGVGASSYILHQNADRHATILHVDTDARWIELTQKNMPSLVSEEYDPTPNFEFYHLNYDIEAYKACGEIISKYEFCKNCPPMGARQYDLILVDGFTPLRETFMFEAWPLLSVGGSMLLHDSRREWVACFVANLIREKFLEIEDVKFHPLDSNMAVIRKGETKQYYDWNKTEAGNNRENPLFTVMAAKGQS